jgi:hypothetical protein
LLPNTHKFCGYPAKIWPDLLRISWFVENFILDLQFQLSNQVVVPRVGVWLLWSVNCWDIVRAYHRDLSSECELVKLSELTIKILFQSVNCLNSQCMPSKSCARVWTIDIYSAYHKELVLECELLAFIVLNCHQNLVLECELLAFIVLAIKIVCWSVNSTL